MKNFIEKYKPLFIEYAIKLVLGLIAGGIGFYIAIQISLSEMNAEISNNTKVNNAQDISIENINEAIIGIQQIQENREDININKQKLELTELYFLEIRFNLIKLFKDNNWKYVPCSELK